MMILVKYTNIINIFFLAWLRYFLSDRTYIYILSLDESKQRETLHKTSNNAPMSESFVVTAHSVLKRDVGTFVYSIRLSHG